MQGTLLFLTSLVFFYLKCTIIVIFLIIFNNLFVKQNLMSSPLVVIIISISRKVFIHSWFFRRTSSLHKCLYRLYSTFFNTLPFFFLTLFSLLVLIQTLGQPTLRGHQRRAGRQRSNRDLISWRKPSPRKDSRRLFAMVISDMSQFPPIRHPLGFSRVSIV